MIMCMKKKKKQKQKVNDAKFTKLTFQTYNRMFCVRVRRYKKKKKYLKFGPVKINELPNQTLKRNEVYIFCFYSCYRKHY